ncbi:MAG: helix-turn-helix domain-containing protein [Candidatus Micrarchaeia archaeon]
MIEELVSTGLTKNEAEVYIALNEIGTADIKELVKKTGLHAPRVYENLNRLVAKGLAFTVFIKNKKRYRAASPDALLAIIEERKRKIEGILPLLIKKRSLSRYEQEVEVRSGDRDIRTALSEIVDYAGFRGEILSFNENEFAREMPDYWMEWQKHIRKMNVGGKTIFEKEFAQPSIALLSKKTEIQGFPFHFIVCRDFVLLCFWDAEPHLAIALKDKATAEGFRGYFETVWNKTK